MRIKNGVLVLIIIFSCCWLEVYTQNIAVDTMHIQEVSVVKSRKNYFSEGYQKEEITNEQLKQFELRTIGEVLQYSSGVNVRSYGAPGASASISLRGLGASHTQVNWNGLPINSVTLGSADISNIPVGINQSFSIVPGASGVNYGSGTFGGALNIDYNSNEQSLKDIGTATLSYGAMNATKASVSFNSNSGRVKSSTYVWGDMSDGDFKYYDEIKQEEYKRSNADYHQFGFQQYVVFKPDGNSEIKGGIWGQIKDLNLPSIEGTSLDNHENQKDSVIRVFLQWKRVFDRSFLNLKGAWFYSDEHYTKRDNFNINTFLIDSRIKSSVYYGDIGFRSYVTDNFSVDFGCLYNYTLAKVEHYGGSKNEHSVAGTIGVKYVFGKLKANGAVRKDWGEKFSSKMLLNIGTEYEIKKDVIIIRSAFSQKFRRPTFNDLYWVNVGNPYLKPEDGYSYELGSVLMMDSNRTGKLKFDASVYYSRVNNMIVWNPNGALWYPTNYEDVLTRGADIKISSCFKVNDLIFNSRLSTSYNKAIIKKNHGVTPVKNKVLFYSPKWISSINSNIGYKDVYLDINWRFVSKRVFDDQGGVLNPYWIVSSSITKDFMFANTFTSISLGLDNINDTRYQMVRSYPMPGRVWNVKIKIMF